MTISFNQDTDLTVVTEFDEETDNIVNEEVMSFKAGEPVDCMILGDENEDYIDIEFPKGVAFGVQFDCFTIESV